MKASSILWAMLVVFTLDAEARVRDLSISSTEMGHIYLKMGKSTVLRFADKPKNVVIGNQNYFNIEFIGNDVTIQPLGQVSTNLFVYGEYQTYGLILNVRGSGVYDDLVTVRRKAPQVKPAQGSSKPDARRRPIHHELSYKGALGKRLKVEATGIFFHPDLNAYVMDLIFYNQNEDKILSQDISVSLTRRNQALEKQQTVFSKDKAISGEAIRSRVIFSDKAESFTLNTRFKDYEWKQIINYRYLR